MRRVTLKTFYVDRFDVTNAEFAKFVAATGYVTDAERKPRAADYPDIPGERLLAGGAVFTPRSDDSPPVREMEWCEFVPRADWRHPYGPKSSIVGHESEPSCR